MKLRHLISATAVLWSVGWTPGYSLKAQQADLPPEVVAYADIVLYNGKILTADEQFSTAEAAAIRDGKFLAVGKSDRILRMAGPRTRKVNLNGKTATPGFVDTHQHPFTEGMRGYLVSKNKISWEGKNPNPRDVTLQWNDSGMMLRDVKRAVAAAKPGESVLIPAGITSLCVSGPNAVKLEDLDAISPNNPVVIIAVVNDWPEAVNSKAAQLVQKFVTGPMFRREGSPCLTIGVRETVSSYFYSHIPFEEMVQASRQATNKASSLGLTTVKEHTALPFMTGIRELWIRNELTVRVRMPYPIYPLTGQQAVIPPDQAEKIFMHMGNLSRIGDDMFRLIGIRPSAVGGNIMWGSAWTIDPKKQELSGLPDRPNGLSSGTWDPERGSYDTGKGEVFAGSEALLQAIRYGWDVATDHTVGDKAVEEVLKVMEDGMKTRVVKRPGQLLAMGHTPMARPEQLAKMKQLGIRPGIGPWHVFTSMMIEPAFIQYGTERINQMEPLKSFITTGLKPSLEGDTFGDPTFWKIYAAVTRKDQKYARVWNPQERVTRQEALWMSTRWPAYQLDEENKLGSVENGKLADLIVLDRDYMTIPDDDIPKIDVLMTIMGGKVVYEMEGGLK